MPEVKIGVGANAGGADAAIQKITTSMNKLGASVAANQKLKFEPTGVKDMARDLDLINKQFKQTLALSAQIRNALKASGQSGLHISQVDWSKTSTDPRAAQRMRDRAFTHSVRGTSLDPTLSNEVDGEGNALSTAKAEAKQAAQESRDRVRESAADAKAKARDDAAAAKDSSRSGGFGRGVRRYGRGMAGRTAGAFGGGVGGPVGGVLQEGVQGAGSGAEAGGLLGGLGGLGAGLLGGGAIALAGMAGKAISEGISQAQDRNLDLDTLKRSLGDLGVSFKGLSDASWKAASGLGMANGEFVKMESLANSASGGAYRTPDELAGATRSGVDISRAYGLQPSQGVQFTAGMQRMNSHQDNKELAASLAEAIVNTQGKATPSEVMQAMQSFAAQQNRFNSGTVDLNRFGNAYSDLLSGDGMTADHASSILGQANSAMQQMGGSEASRNFTMQAFGNLDPIRAAMRAEGGLFGNGLDNRDIAGYMSQHGAKGWDGQGRGPEGTNFSVIRDSFDNAYKGRGQYGTEMELDAEKNYFGLKSYADTASFMNMSDSDHSRIAGTLKNAGVSLKDVREGGIQSLAGISNANSFDDLEKLYRTGPDSIRSRKDMSEDDLSSLDRAEKGGDFAGFQKQLVRVMAGKGQEDTAGSTQRSIDANISDMKTSIGEKLVPAVLEIEQDFLKLLNFFGLGDKTPAPPPVPGSPAAQKLAKAAAVAAGGPAAQKAPGGSTTGGAGNARAVRAHGDGPSFVGLAKDAFYGARRAAYDTRLTGLESQYGLPSGLMDGVWGAETNHGRNNTTSGAGAKGNFQMLDGTAKQYGVQIGDFSSESDGAARMYRDLYKANNQNLDKTLAAYNWGQGNLNKDIKKHGDDWEKYAPKETQDYIRKIEKSMGKTDQSQAAASHGDINITLQQSVTTPSGGTKTKTLSTKVAKPAASGMQTPTIIQIPA